MQSEEPGTINGIFFNSHMNGATFECPISVGCNTTTQINTNSQTRYSTGTSRREKKLENERVAVVKTELLEKLLPMKNAVLTDYIFYNHQISDKKEELEYFDKEINNKKEELGRLNKKIAEKTRYLQMLTEKEI